jgi:hypothetical protein
MTDEETIQKLLDLKLTTMAQAFRDLLADPIPLENSGESWWSEREAREIVGSIRRRRRPNKSSGR